MDPLQSPQAQQVDGDPYSDNGKKHPDPDQIDNRQRRVADHAPEQHQRCDLGAHRHTALLPVVADEAA